MKTPNEFQVKVISWKNRLATLSLGINSTYILGSSIPLIAPRDRAVTLFSIPLEEKTPVLFFFGSTLKVPDSATFLKLEYREGKLWVSMSEVPSFPYEMFVSGNTVALKLPRRGLVSTSNIQGAYKVTHDALCKFLIGDITENELLAEELLLLRLSGLEEAPQQCLELVSTGLMVRDKK
jgi:hypothetical protein